ncbi:RNA RECOGNITION MOTIF RRM DOMAIN CONTAINING PROTEIN [Salix koriyanagi]|uniref:RNA RECOGNITION MOTIF RRM DOMAIN CONTAINING PROTEIN n=1 Tax=Salix koriyanagi TaxID=2511006 RepID=A0A9Q0SL66_9ROSI|nr:RNA RECOGNITION MOTIF RRM DOMAIN CONTAINING PROTEIN [Salix koriyanagi]
MTLSEVNDDKHKSVMEIDGEKNHPVVDSSSLDDVNAYQSKAGETEEEFSKTRLLASNVPWDCTAEDIRSMFEKFGTVVDVELSMYSKTRNRGLAFITMGSPEEAVAALTNLESYEFEGRTLKMNYAKLKKKKPSPPPPPKPGPTFNLFVANLPFEAKSKDLKEFFITEGANVVSAEVIFHDNPRRPSGYGFVAFKTRKEADDALSTFSEKEFIGRQLRVARSRQFVKQRKEDASHSDGTSASNIGLCLRFSFYSSQNSLKKKMKKVTELDLICFRIKMIYPGEKEVYRAAAGQGLVVKFKFNMSKIGDNVQCEKFNTNI